MSYLPSKHKFFLHKPFAITIETYNCFFQNTSHFIIDPPPSKNDTDIIDPTTPQKLCIKIEGKCYNIQWEIIENSGHRHYYR